MSKKRRMDERDVHIAGNDGGPARMGRRLGPINVPRPLGRRMVRMRFWTSNPLTLSPMVLYNNFPSAQPPYSDFQQHWTIMGVCMKVGCSPLDADFWWRAPAVHTTTNPSVETRANFENSFHLKDMDGIFDTNNPMQSPSVFNATVGNRIWGTDLLQFGSDIRNVADLYGRFSPVGMRLRVKFLGVVPNQFIPGLVPGNAPNFNTYVEESRVLYSGPPIVHAFTTCLPAGATFDRTATDYTQSIAHLRMTQGYQQRVWKRLNQFSKQDVSLTQDCTRFGSSGDVYNPSDLATTGSYALTPVTASGGTIVPAGFDYGAAVPSQDSDYIMFGVHYTRDSDPTINTGATAAVATGRAQLVFKVQLYIEHYGYASEPRPVPSYKMGGVVRRWATATAPPVPTGTFPTVAQGGDFPQNLVPIQRPVN